MKNSILRIILSLLPAVLFSGCGLLDSKEDLHLTDEMLKTRYYHLTSWGYRAYNYIPNGFDRIDGNLFATVSDEAQYVTTLSSAARFNDGSWNQYSNPDDCWDYFYRGIHDVNYFIENTPDYAEDLALNRDTITISGKQQYEAEVLDVFRLRREAIVLRAYYYFELLKRYGGVPVMNSTDSDPYGPRADYDDIVSMIVDDIDSAAPDLVESWREENLGNKDGRVTLGVAKALKSRILLYAARPLHNPSGDTGKWEKAAAAADEVIRMGRWSLAPSYRGLFLTASVNTNPEVIWARRDSENNKMETANYPIATNGGKTGVCPSYNLVMAYERLSGSDPSDLSASIDPRYNATIVGNLDEWTGRKLQIYLGGTDDPSNPNSSVTGFYLKKFLNDNLNLTIGETEIHSWIIFRYAEILLNYAEAMNELYGPDGKGEYGMSAREAVNMVRSREDVGMPGVSAVSKEEMRDAIKHERRIELAFEEHRFWDLLHWKDAEKVLNEPITGAVWTEGSRKAAVKEVAGRKFDASKMYLYPIPQTEIVRTGHAIEQNPNW